MKHKCLPKSPLGSAGKRSYGQQQVQPAQTFSSRDIAGTSPNGDQFAPTEGELLPQHQKMAGMSG